MKNQYHSKAEFTKAIRKEKPPLVFITGKASTGKTTLSRELDALGYQLVVLDSIVLTSIVARFQVPKEADAFPVYKGEVCSEWTNSFIRATYKAISSKLKNGPVLVEGALANNEILKKIFRGDLENFFFIFLSPSSIPKYTQRIKKRFTKGIDSRTTGLPPRFFSVVDDDEIKKYLDTHVVSATLLKKIEKFAIQAAKESAERLQYFKTEFNNIVVVQI